MDYNQWQEIKIFINSKQPGTTFTRSEMVERVHGMKLGGKLTIDKYRRFLTVLGYLERIGTGQYLVKDRVPRALSRRKAEDIYYAELRRQSRETRS